MRAARLVVLRAGRFFCIEPYTRRPRRSGISQNPGYGRRTMTTYTIETILDEARDRSDKYPDREFVMCNVPSDEFWLKAEGAQLAALTICARAKERGLDARLDADTNGVIGGMQNGVPCFFPAVRLYRLKLCLKP